MKLESQVVSLELAKELKENGYVQEGLWWWQVYKTGDILLITYANAKGFIDKTDVCEYFVAPTVAELGEALPYSQCKLVFRNVNKKYCFYNETGGLLILNTEADARAKMILFLVKKGLLKW